MLCEGAGLLAVQQGILGKASLLP